ncbi:MAG: hypothetical protein IPP83_03560 [Flavobacteriales bacterium]|nr:hypothetical protein [Flavobacteriales bacterium]
MNLVSRSRDLQMRINHEVALLDELSHINDDLHQLSIIHRVDLNAGQHRW